MVRELAVHVELFEFGSDSFGAGIAVFLGDQEGLAQTGEGVEHAEVADGRWQMAN